MTIIIEITLYRTLKEEEKEKQAKKTSFDVNVLSPERCRFDKCQVAILIFFFNFFFLFFFFCRFNRKEEEERNGRAGICVGYAQVIIILTAYFPLWPS